VSIPAKVADASAEKALRAILLWLGGILGFVLIAANIIELLFFGGPALADLAHKAFSVALRIQKNAPKDLKVCPRNCFVISTTRNAAATPQYGFGSSFQGYLEQKNNREVMCFRSN